MNGAAMEAVGGRRKLRGGAARNKSWDLAAQIPLTLTARGVSTYGPARCRAQARLTEELMSTPATAPPLSRTEAPVLITGAAGFIGFHVAKALLERGQRVVGLDNLNDYYSVALKQARLEQLNRCSEFTFEAIDVSDCIALRRVAQRTGPRTIIHLAAQVGVRNSVTNPDAYVASNLVGFANVLECARHNDVAHLVYASSSSVYGANTHTPFSVEDNVDHPVSLYAATKKANELMAHSYSHLYRIPTTGLRFFTVYGPWGRPDMAVYRFADAIEQGAPIQVYNQGDMQRDFTYIDDVVTAIVRLSEKPPLGDPTWSSDAPSPATSSAPYRVYNIGNSQPIPLMELIATLEACLNKKAIKQFLPMQAGDVPITAADVSHLAREVDFQPRTSLRDGLNRFVDWYRAYHGSSRS